MKINCSVDSKTSPNTTVFLRTKSGQLLNPVLNNEQVQANSITSVVKRTNLIIWVCGTSTGEWEFIIPARTLQEYRGKLWRSWRPTGNKFYVSTGQPFEFVLVRTNFRGMKPIIWRTYWYHIEFLHGIAQLPCNVISDDTVITWYKNG